MLTTKVRTQTLIRMILPPGALPLVIRMGKAPRAAEWGLERNGATNRACRPFSNVGNVKPLLPRDTDLVTIHLLRRCDVLFCSESYSRIIGVLFRRGLF